jgi:hypothetical protein
MTKIAHNCDNIDPKIYNIMWKRIGKINTF